MTKDAEYVTTVDVLSQDNSDYTTLEVWRDPTTKRIFAVERDFTEAFNSDEAPIELISPYNKMATLRLVDG